MQGIMHDPTPGRFESGGKLTALRLHLGETVEYGTHPVVPHFPLESGPVVEVGRIIQGKAFQKISAVLLDCVLEVSEQRRAGLALEIPRAGR